jgi:hypothetical protein
MDLVTLKIVYGVLGVALWYPIFRIVVNAVQALKTGECRPDKRLPIVRKAEQPIAYWLFVIFSFVFGVPFVAAFSAVFVGAALGIVPIVR